MESGALSTEAFRQFTGKVVPYLNVMTRIEGRPHDNLLVELGYGGHPTLLFLSPDGEKLGRPRDRTVETFDRAFAAIGELAAVERRQSAGEKGLEFERFLLEFELMKLRGGALRQRAKTLQGLSDDQQARLDAILFGEEVGDLVIRSLDGPEDLKAAGMRMLEILDGGRCPEMVKDANAWSVLARYGETTQNRALLLRCSKGLAENFPDDPRMQSWSRSLEQKAKSIRGTSL